MSAADLPGDSPAERLRESAPALVGAVLATGVAVAGSGGRMVITGVVLALQAVLALAWLAVTAVNGARVALLLVLGAAFAADVLAWHRSGAGVGNAAGVVAVAFVAGLVWQLARRSRSRVTESLASLGAALVFVVLLAHLVSLRATRGSSGALAAVALAVAAALVASELGDGLLPGPRLAPGATHTLTGLVAGVVAGSAAGLLACAAWSPLSSGAGAVLGVLVGFTTVLASVGVDLVRADAVDERAAAACRPLAALAPLAVAAPVGYAAVRLIVG